MGSQCAGFNGMMGGGGSGQSPYRQPFQNQPSGGGYPQMPPMNGTPMGGGMPLSNGPALPPGTPSPSAISPAASAGSPFRTMGAPPAMNAPALSNGPALAAPPGAYYGPALPPPGQTTSMGTLTSGGSSGTWAKGGPVGYAPGGAPDAFSRNAMHEIAHAGLIKSPVAGRTDQINMSVPSGSYILPADHVSHLGQGNTIAGASVLDRMFGTPKIPHFHSTIPHPALRASGGRATEGRYVPIIVAGGEYVLEPDQVKRVGSGDLKKGHDTLDEWVKSERKKHVKTLRNLPGPKK